MNSTTTAYAGIDYSLGQSNVDSNTGIHYGVISQHSVNPDALNDIFTQGEDIQFAESLKEYLANAKIENEKDGTEFDEDAATQDFADGYESDGGLNDYLYEQDGYKLTGCLDSDLFVLRSPFYTFAQFCSPCVPGSGNLDSPCETGPKTYCLGHDWFEDNKAPYAVYSVETGEIINS